MAVLGYLPKLKRGLGLASDAHFLHNFQHHTFFHSQDIEQNVLLNSYLNS